MAVGDAVFGVVCADLTRRCTLMLAPQAPGLTRAAIRS